MTSNPTKEEVVKIFKNIDIEIGIEKILATSPIDFTYEKSKLPFGGGYDEIWNSTISNHELFDIDVRYIDLELHRINTDKKSKCYDANLRVQYTKKSTLNSDYEALISKFETLNTMVQQDYLAGRDFPVKFDISSIKLGRKMKNAELHIGKIEDEHADRLILNITYSKCPTKD